MFFNLHVLEEKHIRYVVRCPLRMTSTICFAIAISGIVSLDPNKKTDVQTKPSSIVLKISPENGDKV